MIKIDKQARPSGVYYKRAGGTDDECSLHLILLSPLASRETHAAGLFFMPQIFAKIFASASITCKNPLFCNNFGYHFRRRNNVKNKEIAGKSKHCLISCHGGGEENRTFNIFLYCFKIRNIFVY
jgi:hypothetical protein